MVDHAVGACWLRGKRAACCLHINCPNFPGNQQWSSSRARAYKEDIHTRAELHVLCHLHTWYNTGRRKCLVHENLQTIAKVLGVQIRKTTYPPTPHCHAMFRKDWRTDGMPMAVLQENLSLKARRIPILQAGARCSGNESALIECARPGSRVGLGDGTEQCGLSDIVSLACVNDAGEGMVPPCQCAAPRACVRCRSLRQPSGRRQPVVKNLGCFSRISINKLRSLCYYQQ